MRCLKIVQFTGSDSFELLSSVQEYDFTSPFEEDAKDKRKRNWVFVIYPEWENIGDILLRITSASCYYFISPCHRDFGKDGRPLKPHFHVLVMFGNARCESSVVSLFGLESNYRIFACTNVLSYIRYLIHFGWNKTQYPKELIRSNNTGYIERAFSDDFGNDAFYGVQLLREALKTIRFKSEWDLEIWCYEHHLERVFHSCRSSIHNSWYEIQEQCHEKWVDARTVKPPKDCPFGPIDEIEYHNFEMEDYFNEP